MGWLCPCGCSIHTYCPWMSPQTNGMHRKTVWGIDNRKCLTGYGTGDGQKVLLTREQIRRPLQNVDSLLLGQPPLSEEMDPYEIEVWYRGPGAIVGEELAVGGFVCGWMGDILTLAFRVCWLIVLE